MVQGKALFFLVLLGLVGLIGLLALQGPLEAMVPIYPSEKWCNYLYENQSFPSLESELACVYNESDHKYHINQSWWALREMKE